MLSISDVKRANNDPNVKLIVLDGNGKGFCSGYDLQEFAETPRPTLGSQNMPWDPVIDYQFMWYCTECFMSLWRGMKPVIGKIHGYAVAGGSDIALCCDLILTTDDTLYGYPPARIWGTPTTAMWVYRLGPERAKRMLLTGDLINGKEAEQIGLVTRSYKNQEELNQGADELIQRLTKIPTNQLVMQKMLVNQAYDNMGLNSTQRLATFFDGVSRHSPEGCAFKKRAEEVGFKQAVLERDSPQVSDIHYKISKL
jgi:enoyl-CoA hydratase